MIEAAAHGADAILLIAAILDVKEMRRFRELAATLHMSAIVEVHDADELEAAIESGADIIGVNNRDLRTFEVNLVIPMHLSNAIPAGVTKVAESGIHSRRRRPAPDEGRVRRVPGGRAIDEIGRSRPRRCGSCAS